MKILGRNELCYCGSGKKFKRCHGLQTKYLQDVISEIYFHHPQREVIERTFLEAQADFNERPLAGACHLLSSVMGVLFAEQGISSDLKIGVVRRKSDDQVFTHSWVEIENRIFDVAIQHILNGEQSSPVFAGFDISSILPAPYTYGINCELDMVGRDVYETPFGEYMDQCPFYEDGGWSIVQRIATKLGITTTIQEFRSKYKIMKRVHQYDFVSPITPINI
ncbi:SEC-C metal-binding domain-containing protein [Paenibacillus sp. GCM10027628]|uniref:SEC-C metal-binding domain-containing protein n=1 Tax=Paenibacillus sp. GCM10027628 TaxID=3273413 RepID=UPI00363623BE